MGEWREVALQEVTEIQQGKRVDHAPVGALSHAVFGANGVIGSWTAGTYSHPVVGLGCRGSVGTVHQVPAGSWLGNNVMGVWPKANSNLDLGFLQLLLETADLKGSGAIAGQVQPQITRTSLSPLRVEIPPMEEQRRIVDLIGALDAHSDALSKERFAAGTMLRSCVADIAEADSSVEVTLGEIAKMYQPKTLSKNELVESGPFPVYGANGLMGYHDHFNHAEPQVAITCRGATCGVVNWTPPNCWITGNAMVVQPVDERASQRFLYWSLKYLCNVSTTISGSAQPQITRTSLSPLRVTLSSRLVQDRLVEAADSAERALSAIDSEVEQLRRFRRTVLAALLGGEIAIPSSYDALLVSA